VRAFFFHDDIARRSLATLRTFADVQAAQRQRDLSLGVRVASIVSVDGERLGERRKKLVKINGTEEGNQETNGTHDDGGKTSGATEGVSRARGSLADGLFAWHVGARNSVTKSRYYDGVVVGGGLGGVWLTLEVGILPHDMRLWRLKRSVKKKGKRYSGDHLRKYMGREGPRSLEGDLPTTRRA
jgi:hypothetical protein